MVAAVRTNPFVTTLSTLLIFRGAAFIILGGQPLSHIRVFQAIDSGFTLGTTFLPFRGVLFLALTCLSWLILRQTVFGQHIYALGGNAEAARLSGVKTVRLRVETFILSGLAAGVATILFLSWLRVAKPDTATGYELDSIAACVVGGVSLQGGRGSILARRRMSAAPGPADPDHHERLPGGIPHPGDRHRDLDLRRRRPGAEERASLRQ